MASGSGAHLNYTGNPGSVGVADMFMPFQAAYLSSLIEVARDLWKWKSPGREMLVFLGSLGLLRVTKPFLIILFHVHGPCNAVLKKYF